MPQPRIAAGEALRGLANSAIDLSDGLLADLGHILSASGVGATIDLVQLPLSTEVSAWIAERGDWRVALAGGDDYELCFTVPAQRRNEIEQISQQIGLAMSCIGVVESTPGLRISTADGQPWCSTATGFDHFAPSSTAERDD
jgi:thiamine-monophosphate kinase